MLTLYTYFRSSAAYRVRIALHLKGLSYASVPVHLLRDGGEQHAPAYAQINPTELVPTLVDGNLTLGQSLAIMEYLEEQNLAPALLPNDAAGRARVRALAQNIACDIHPLNNLRVLQYLKNELQHDEATCQQWSQHWIKLGLTALEAQLNNNLCTGQFSHGNTPTLADCCLIPQLFNARRINTPLDAFPTLLRVESACLALDAFQRAAPHAQADAA
jgi:maleylacetoacetate isomerase